MIEPIAGGYKLTEPDGATITFDSAGVLTQMADHFGNTQTLSYANGKLSAVDDSLGRRLDFSYNADGRLEFLTTPVGVFQYSYDPTTGNLTTVTNPSGHNRSYIYDDPNDPHNLTGIVNENDIRSSTVMYDNLDRATTSEGADGTEKLTVNYDSDLTRSLIDSLGRITTFTLQEINGIARIKSSTGNGCGSCPNSVGEVNTFNDRLRVTKSTDARGNITQYTYDDRGNVLTKTEAFGTPVARTTTYTYDPNFSLVKTISRPSLNKTGQNTVITLDYVNGALQHMTETGYLVDGVTQVTSTTTYQHNSAGQLTFIDGPRTDVSDTVTLDYFPNEAAQGLNRGQLWKITNALGQVTMLSQYNGWGKPELLTDANSIDTTYIYNSSGKVESETTNGLTTVYGYDNIGNLTSIQYSGGRIISYHYTAADQLERITDNQGNSLHFSYDTEGNRVREEVRDATGALTRYLDFEPDNLNRLWKTIYPDGTYEQRLYDANDNLESLRAPTALTTLYAYDDLNRLTHMTQPGSTITKYGYDRHDNHTSVTDAKNIVTTYAYDDLGRRQSVNSPDSGVTVYGHDPAGNQILSTDANNITVSYAFDALNRLTSISFPDSTRDISYTYDQGANGMGRLTGMSDAAGAMTYAYNTHGNLATETRVTGGLPVITSYGYNAASGLLDTVTYPSGLVITYQRDTTGRIEAIFADGANVLRDIKYMPFGPVEDVTLGNNILTVDRTYNDRYLVERIKAGNMDYRYQYYADGSVSSDAGIAPPALTGDSTVWTYQLGASLIDTATIGQQQTQYSHDSHGNITSDGTRNFIYDQDNRLIEVKEGTTTIAAYSYDGFGRRVKKVAGGAITLFQYDKVNNLIAETDEAGNPLRDYIYLDSEPVAMKLYGAQAGLYFFLNDRLGTPQKVVGSAGNLVWQAAYFPFGKAQLSNDIITNNLRFPGQYYDAETGLHYNWNRYYDPEAGRYLTPDPIGLAGGINLYAYGLNNPVNRVDPSGLWTLSLGVYANAALGGGGGGGTAINVGHSEKAGWSFSLTGTAQGGAYAGAGAFVGGGLTYTNADNVNQLNGTSYQFGRAGLGVGPISGAVEGVKGSDYSGGSFYLGTGLGYTANSATVSTTSTMITTSNNSTSGNKCK